MASEAKAELLADVFGYLLNRRKQTREQACDEKPEADTPPVPEELAAD